MSDDLSIDEILGTESSEDECVITEVFGHKVESPCLRGATYRQLKWLKYYLDEENKTTFMNSSQAALAAGYGQYNNARSANKHRFKPLIQKWMDDYGLSELHLKAKIKNLIGAKETKILKIKGAVNRKELPPHIKILGTSGVIEEDRDGEFYGSGETVLAVEMESLGIQTKNVETACKLYGLNAPEKKIISGDPDNPIMTINTEMSPEQAAEVYNKMLK